MSDISALESRITAALDRIRKSVESSPAQATDGSGLQAALQAEKATKAKLEERVQVLKERQDKQIKALNAKVDAQRTQLSSLDAELQQLRASNTKMRELNAQLREAATAGASAELLDTAMAAEVEALRVQRSAEVAEIDAILTELKPLVEEASHAAD